MTNVPRIQFEDLKGFPEIENNQPIETEAFLNASKEIVGIIETFGKIFNLITKDMNGNIVKLNTAYAKDKQKFHYLDDLIIKNINVDKKYASDSLLWLKRALRLLCIFFENIYNDKQNLENLKIHLQDAYDKTLKPYHGWLVQNALPVIYRWAPTRSQLIGVGVAHDKNIIVLKEFLPRMKAILDHIDVIYTEYNLEENYIV